MKNVTVTMDETVLQRARIAAAREGKSLSKFIAETVERRIGKPMTQKEALDRFLSGPLMDLTDENGNAPTRDEIYERSRLR
jgi:hypothetical protein